MKKNNDNDDKIKEYVSGWGKLPGRPRNIKSVEEMEELIDEYFLDMCGYKIIEGTDEIIFEPPTVTALALHLGFTSRMALLRYEGYGPEYKKLLKMAKLYIESEIEKGSLTGRLNSKSCQFNLKNNYNWKEKTELDIGNAPDRKFNINFTKYEKKITDNKD